MKEQKYPLAHYTLENPRGIRYGMRDRADWIIGLQEKMELTQTEFAKRFGVTQATVSRWRKGAKPEIQNWEALMDAAVMNAYPLLNETSKATVPLVGYVGAGTAINLFGNGQGPFDEVEMPPDATDRTVAVEVRGDSMGGAIKDRYILYYDNLQEPPTDNLLGQLCVVSLADERMLVKNLAKGRIPDRYDLYSTNAEPLFDQEVVWAAEVLWIKPRRS